jgi:hypothetical protein
VFTKVQHVENRNSESSCAGDGAEILPLQILPIWPKDLFDRSSTGRKKLIAVIERELRKERQRGLAGDAAYDLARHAKLVEILRKERRALAAFNFRDFGIRGA